MPIREEDLKKQLKEKNFERVYFLYGEESYLSEYYAGQIVSKVVGDGELAAFNLQKFDGQDFSIEQLEDAVESLPLMAERKCVVVRDYDATESEAGVQTRVLKLIPDLPEECVLVFWADAIGPNGKKNDKWKAFMAAIEKAGVCVEFPRKTTAEIVRMLCSGAERRGCTLRPDTARFLVEQSGNSLNLLLNELDKLAALVGEGEITREIVESAATRNLEASVFDLSKAILQNHYERAYNILGRLAYQKEEPVAVLSVLSSTYVDLYRVKVALAAGQQAESLKGDFAYRGREFRLSNAARDCSRLSIEVLRKSLDVLGQADTLMKSTRVDAQILLEETAAKLILLARTGGNAT